MTNIGAVCLITIGIWIVIELAVQFGKYHHRCVAGISKHNPVQNPIIPLPKATYHYCSNKCELE